MNAPERVKRLVTDLLTGTKVQAAWRRLSTSGQRVVDAILDALEGRSSTVPDDRESRDVYEDLVAGLQAIARVNPGLLIRALDHRREHTFSLIWALGSSQDAAAVQKLIEYANDSSKWVRWAAVAGLARVRRKAVLTVLLAALRDRSDMVRLTALEGLTRVADPTAIKPLKRYLAGRRLQPGGRRIASELLRKLERT